MRTLITHPSILCLCGSGAHHCEPKLSDGHSTFHVKREIVSAEESVHNDTVGVLPLPSGILSLYVVL